MSGKEENVRTIRFRNLCVLWVVLSGFVFVGPGSTQDLVKVKYCIASKILPAQIANVFIGEYLGYYKEEGIDPEFITSDGAAQILAFVMRNQVQMGSVNDALLPAVAKGEDIPVTMVFNYTRGMIYQFGVKPDSKIQTIKDLKGKKVGTLSFGTGVYTQYIPAALKSVGLDLKDVEVVAVGQDYPAAKALYDGRVDALALWRSNYIQMGGMGFPIRLVPQPPFIEKIKAGHGIGVTKEYLKNNRKTIVGFFRALSKGMAFYNANYEATVKIHWKMFPYTKPKGMTEEEALKATIPMLEERAPTFDKDVGDGINQYGQFGKEAWEAFVEFIGLKGKVDPAKYYTNELIPEINNFDVQKIIKQAKTFDITKFKSPVEKYQK